MISDILLEILKDVNEVYDDQIHSTNELVNDVISYIYEHYGSSVTLKEMSAKLYVSEEHMIRIFKKGNRNDALPFFEEGFFGLRRPVNCSYTVKVPPKRWHRK